MNKYAHKDRYSHMDLSGANLTHMDFRGANCYCVDFRDANCSYANFRGAGLRGANFSRANLTGAILPYSAPRVRDLDRKILEALDAGGILDMWLWHSFGDAHQKNSHCRAGWAVIVAGTRGLDLEFKIGTNAAAALIYAASGRPIIPDWYATNEEAMLDMKSTI